MAVVAYGVGVNCSISLEALPIADPARHLITIDVRRISKLAVNQGVWIGEGSAQNRRIQCFYHDSHLAYQIEELISFELYSSLDRIICHVAQDVSDDVLRYWILQQILPLQLRLCGYVEPLHGSSVSALSAADQTLDGSTSCVGFLGLPYAGKSTLLAYLLTRGHELVADDQIALAATSYMDVFPAVPYYRPDRAAESLGVTTRQYSPLSRPLRRLYFLQPAHKDAKVQLDRLEPSKVLALLMMDKQFILHNKLAPKFLPLLGQRFKGLAHMSRQIPAFRLQVPRSMDRLPEVYDVIQQDLAS